MRTILPLFLLFSSSIATAQLSQVLDNFEGGGTISSWAGDDCLLDNSFENPFQQGINTSENVLRYHDLGGSYANVRFTNSVNFNWGTGTSFSLKLYVPSDGLTGSSPNQISLKLQNGFQPEPWTTQTEIIQPIVLDQWQELIFDFASGNHINFNAGSPEPTARVDFNRLLIQLNGENNNNHVLAYIDDIVYDGLIGYDPDESMSIYDELVWSDEFETVGPVNPDNWFHQTQLPNSWGWHNGELQHYTDEMANSYIDDGHLHIVAKRLDYFDQGLLREFTSARLNCKYAFTYGRVEVRAKLPTGLGTWPAIWTLGKNISEQGAYWYPEFGDTPWPVCGEIDIMEHWGWNQNHVQSTLHTAASSGASENYGGLYAPDVSEEFHVYGMEWDEEEIRFTVDGQIHYLYHPAVQNPDTWPYFEDQYLILNVAIQESIEASFEESEMVLDYVRVYQEEPNSTAEHIELNFSVFPNPSQAEVHVRSKSNQLITATQVLDMAGRLVLDNTIENFSTGLTTIDISTLSTGIYVLRVSTAHTEENLIIEKR